MDWNNMMNGYGGMGAWMWIFAALVVALLALGVVAVIRGMTPGVPSGVEAPLTIAGGRLARGEITKDEYDQIRDTLTGVSR